MMNPELNGFLDRWQQEWASLAPGASLADRRAHFEVIATNMRLPTPDGVNTDAEHWVENPAGPVRLRAFRPSAGGKQSALVYMHGGAWMQGSPETHWDITARLAAWSGATVFSVDYALCPEHPFPAAYDQVTAVMRWAAENADSLGIDPSRLSIGGDSAGANLAAAVALGLRSEVALSGQLLIYPACDFDMTRPSMIENAEAPILQTKGMPMVNRMYVGGEANEALLTTDPRVAPLVAESHAGLPPTFLAVAENDPLRDSGTAYRTALETAGVEVTFDPGKGLIHGYLRAMDHCADSMAALQRMAEWLAKQ